MKHWITAILVGIIVALILPPPLYGQGSITVVDLALGCEPSIESAGDGNLVVFWIDPSARQNAQQQLWRRTSSNSGVSWASAAAIPKWTRAGEPTMAYNAALGHFYYGWLSRDVDGGTDAWIYTATSKDSPLAPIVSDAAIYNDRPWVIACHPYAYLSMYKETVTAKEIHFKRSDVIDSEGDLAWPTTTQKVAFTTLANNYKYDIYSQRLAKGRISGENNFLYLMALRIHITGTLSDSSLKVFRSSDNGSNWDAGSDGWSGGSEITNFPDPNTSDPDIFGLNVRIAKGMFAYHVLADPNSGNVYVLYTQMGLRSADGEFVTKLYCRRSRDDGATWDDPVQIIPETTMGTFPRRVNSGDGSENYGDVPYIGNTHFTGYYRIGRVWGALDGAGRLHVVWMDNRAGKSPYLGIEDGEQYYRDHWEVYRSVCADPSDTPMVFSSQVLEVSLGLSIGGFGIPSDAPRERAWLPPGDTMECRADASNLYVAWPDTSNYDPNDPDTELGRVRSGASRSGREAVVGGSRQPRRCPGGGRPSSQLSSGCDDVGQIDIFLELRSARGEPEVIDDLPPGQRRAALVQAFDNDLHIISAPCPIVAALFGNRPT
ncbi:MAG: exo-alpha-sialidase [Phycisphaerales bacterium]|nr:exo-alpha-sialidase [Phycisphaerales bacterium]